MTGGSAARLIDGGFLNIEWAGGKISKAIWRPDLECNLDRRKRCESSR